MSADETREDALRVRHAAMRADAIRALMPLCAVDTAARLIIERKLSSGSGVPRSAASAR